MASSLHKKANIGTIVTIIVILLGFVVVAMVMKNLFTSAEKLTEGKECYTALGVQELFDKVPVFTFENSCKTIISDIPESKKGIRKNIQISEQIAKKMMNAWDIVHKGEIPNMWEEGDWALYNAESLCMVMYTINIEYVPDEEEYSMLDLYAFMLREDYKKVDGITKTYLEYIQLAGGYGSFAMPEIFKGKEKLKVLLPGYTLAPIFLTVPDIDKEELGEDFDFREEIPRLAKDQVYAISIVSPEKSFFKAYLDWGKQSNTFLTFSTLEFADRLGCKQK